MVLGIIITIITVSISVLKNLWDSDQNEIPISKWVDLLKKLRESKKLIAMGINRGTEISSIPVVLDFALLKWINDSSIAPFFSHWGVGNAILIWVVLVSFHFILFLVSAFFGVLADLKIEEAERVPYFSGSMIISLLVGLFALFSSLLVIMGKISMVFGWI